MADGLDQTRSQPSHLRTFVWLAILVVGAFLLRSAFNMGEGFDEETGRQLFTGNDPYYHHRTVTHVVETGSNLNFDPTINYPEGNWNPNPPVWTWTVAPVAKLFEAFGAADPVGTALNVMVAVWGALCVIPVFMIARDLWGRKAGLWAGFFMAISAPHIQRSIWGYADHDAISTFFILLAIAFLVRGFRTMDGAIFVTRWGGGTAMQGIRTAVRTNRNTLVYAALAGISISACALTWKGYPYALAILAVAAVVQLVLDHFRHRDSTTTWLAYLITTGIATVLPWLLYYQAIGQHFSTTVQPSLYVLGGLFVVGLLLVPTRNVPSIVVFPALIVAAIAGLFALHWFLPQVSYVIFSGLGYFSQSKLYSTIAEAQRPSIGYVAANLGFFTFLAAFWAIGHSFKRAYKGQAQFVLVGAWAAISVFLMFAASRFTTNAAPVFCVLLGFVMVRILAIARTDEVRKRFRSQHGQNVFARSFRSLNFRSVAIVGLAVLLFVLPNLWIGTDASMGFAFKERYGLLEPGEVYIDTPTVKGWYPCEQVEGGACGLHWGGFGISQELGPDGRQRGWLESMAYLSTLDTCRPPALATEVCAPTVDGAPNPQYQPMQDRPGFIAWWDYGHWATSIGKHPSVADPFQSHYELSGRFLAADSETEAMNWLSALLLTGDWQANQGRYSQPVKDLMAKPEYAFLSAFDAGYWYDPQGKVLNGNATGDKAFQLYDDLVLATGKKVLYFGADDTMGPFETPNTANQRSPGIIYAPVFLANKNPDAYVKTEIVAGSQTLTQLRYEPDPAGGYRALAEPAYVDATGQRYVVYGDGKFYREGHTPLQDGPSATGLDASGSQSYVPTPLYANTMFARGFGGTAAEITSPGDGLTHWRAIYQATTCVAHNETTGACVPMATARRTVLLQYFHGVQVQGAVRDDAGAPMPGVQVVVVDGFGARHGQGVTDANGTYRLTAPFSHDGDLRLEVRGTNGGVLLMENGTRVQFTTAQAESRAVVPGIDFTVQRGGVTGVVYQNTDGVAGYTAGNDTVLEGVTVSTGPHSATTGADGRYTLAGLQAGDYSLKATLADYTESTTSVTVPSGNTTPRDIPLVLKPATVELNYVDNGVGVTGIPFTITGPTPATGTTGLNGTATVTPQLSPGEYTATFNHTNPETSETYFGERQFTVPRGGNDVLVTVERRL